MPNRILRDWTDSEPVNSLSWQAECLFIRLIMKADDYGCFNGNAKLLRSLLFPLKDGLRDTDISRWIAECVTAGLIRVYRAENKPFIEIRNYRQRLKNSRRKFPAPPETSENSPEVYADSENFPELPGTSRNFPAESESETETNKKEIYKEKPNKTARSRTRRQALESLSPEIRDPPGEAGREAGLRGGTGQGAESGRGGRTSCQGCF